MLSGPGDALTPPAEIETHMYKGVVVQMSVDHDHACCPTQRNTCGECRRGILCHDCNAGIGYLDDDPMKLRAALDYLKKWGIE